MFSFAYPLLFLFLPLPFVVRYLFSAAHGRDDAVYFPFFTEVMKLAKGGLSMRSESSHGWRYILLWLSWGLVLTALARPQIMDKRANVTQVTRDMVLALDISGSMQIGDFALPNSRVTSRMEGVKSLAADFIEKRQGDRIGLILYGTRAYLQAPQTTDLNTVSEMMREAEIGLAGEETAIGDAIGLIIKYLSKQDSPEKVAILFSDGRNNSGNLNPFELLELARSEKIKIYTIGVGSQTPRRGFLSNSGLDEETLIQIAEATGGKYFRAGGAEDMQRIYRIIDTLEPTVAKSEKSVVLIREVFFIPLLLGLFILAFLLGEKSFKKWLNQQQKIRRER